MKYFAEQMNEDENKTNDFEQGKQNWSVPFRETMAQQTEDTQKTDEMEKGKRGSGAL